MATYYIDPINGADANAGDSFAAGHAWQTITLGATAARIAAGDTIRIAKSPNPVSIGDGSWFANTIANGGFPSAITINSCANVSGVIRINVNGSHGLTTGDIVQIVGVVGAPETNGTWKVSVASASDFDLVGSVYSGVRTSGGTLQKVNSKAVYLADSTLVKNITDCETGGLWTNAAGGDCTASYSTNVSNAKEGGNCMKLLMDASPQSSKLQAYFNTGTLDLSGYQKMTLWLYNSAVLTTATTWTITLCSGTNGTTPVQTFAIPALPTIGWQPLTLTPAEGGNLGASIQSIAVSTGITAPAANSYLLLDNILACTTNGLNLQSLISKSGLAQGGDALWYPIQSISPEGNIVLIDNHTANKSAAGRGYFETAETVTTYIRETIKTPLAAAAGTIVQAVLDSGTMGSPIQYQGGYNTSNNTQDGETWFDGLTNSGYGLSINGMPYVTLNYLNFARYNTGVSLPAGVSYNMTIPNMSLVANSNALSASGADKLTVGLLKTNNNGANGGGSFSVSSNNEVSKVIASNNLGQGISYSSSAQSTIRQLIAYNNGTVGAWYNIVGDCKIIDATTAGNNTASFNIASGVATVYKATCGESTYGTGASNWTNPRLGIAKLNGDFSYIYTDGGKIERENSTLSNGTGKQWKITTETNTYRRSDYPIDLSIAKIACVANKLVTVTCWFKKGHATNIAAQLVFLAQLGGAESIATCPSDTNENQLTITFTPTEVGVVEILARAYYVAGHSTVIVDGLAVTQAA
jgi:hypothetical protein